MRIDGEVILFLAGTALGVAIFSAVLLVAAYWSRKAGE